MSTIKVGDRIRLKGGTDVYVVSLLDGNHTIYIRIEGISIALKPSQIVMV